MKKKGVRVAYCGKFKMNLFWTFGIHSEFCLDSIYKNAEEELWHLSTQFNIYNAIVFLLS